MIRQFRPEDAEACSNLIQACIRIEAGLSESLRARLLEAETPQAMLDRARMYYVAVFESDAGVTGVGAVDMNEIRLLYVAPQHQHHGMGRSLLAHLESMIPSALFPDVFLYSSPVAISFYQAHGFLPRGLHPFMIEGEELTTVFMTKNLSSQGA
jgi:N-acetylglutamate synthase-like GNAT family acetyltransferase